MVVCYLGYCIVSCLLDLFLLFRLFLWLFGSAYLCLNVIELVVPLMVVLLICLLLCWFCCVDFVCVWICGCFLGACLLACVDLLCIGFY